MSSTHTEKNNTCCRKQIDMFNRALSSNRAVIEFLQIVSPIIDQQVGVRTHFFQVGLLGLRSSSMIWATYGGEDASINQDILIWDF